jgi:phage repressor protein C with HTH and peptisase S24 domain
LGSGSMSFINPSENTIRGIECVVRLSPGL